MAWVEQIQSVNILHTLACLAGAYALGCVGTGYYLVRAQTGRDLRKVGSGSIGARNVGRVLGRSGFCVTLLADFAKGALAVTVGHVWPVPLGFRGGKGVATSLGGLLVYDWQSALIYATAFAVLFALMRRTILPGLFAYLVLPFTVWWFRQDGVQVALVSGLIGVVWFAHRQNLITEIRELARYRSAEPDPKQLKP